MRFLGHHAGDQVGQSAYREWIDDSHGSPGRLLRAHHAGQNGEQRRHNQLLHTTTSWSFDDLCVPARSTMDLALRAREWLLRVLLRDGCRPPR